MNNSTSAATTPTQISIPTYSPVPTNNIILSQPPQPAMNNADYSELGSSSMFSTVWGGFAAPSASQQRPFGDDENNDNGGMNMNQNNIFGTASESLLQHESQQQYSMGQYFQTFVMDVYNLFRTLPVWVQVVLVAVMIFLVYKLI